MNGEEPDISFDIVDVVDANDDKQTIDQKNETNPEVEAIKESNDTNEVKSNSSEITVPEVSETKIFVRIYFVLI